MFRHQRRDLKHLGYLNMTVATSCLFEDFADTLREAEGKLLDPNLQEGLQIRIITPLGIMNVNFRLPAQGRSDRASSNSWRAELVQCEIPVPGWCVSDLPESVHVAPTVNMHVRRENEFWPVSGWPSSHRLTLYVSMLASSRRVGAFIPKVGKFLGPAH